MIFLSLIYTSDTATRVFMRVAVCYAAPGFFLLFKSRETRRKNWRVFEFLCPVIGHQGHVLPPETYP